LYRPASVPCAPRDLLSEVARSRKNENLSSAAPFAANPNPGSDRAHAKNANTEKQEAQIPRAPLTDATARTRAPHLLLEHMLQVVETITHHPTPMKN
jgi:hypothetical protein